MDSYLLVVSGVSTLCREEAKLNPTLLVTRTWPLIALKSEELGYENHPTLHYLTRTQAQKVALLVTRKECRLVERQDTSVLVSF